MQRSAPAAFQNCCITSIDWTLVESVVMFNLGGCTAGAGNDIDETGTGFDMGSLVGTRDWPGALTSLGLAFRIPFPPLSSLVSSGVFLARFLPSLGLGLLLVVACFPPRQVGDRCGGCAFPSSMCGQQRCGSFSAGFIATDGWIANVHVHSI